MPLRTKIKRGLLNINSGLGKMLGYIARPVPSLGNFFYDCLVWFERVLWDRVALMFIPVVASFGTIFYDRRYHRLVEYFTINGARLRLDLFEKTQRWIYSQKIFEAGETRFLISKIKEGDVCVDVGANVGYYTMLLAQQTGQTGKVISIEPELGNFKRLTDNQVLNNFHNIRLYNCAVGQKTGKSILNINPLNHGGNSLIPFKSYKTGDVVFSREKMIEEYGEKELFQSVDLMRLDDILLNEKIKKVDVLKIDVEGFELEVLRGAKNLIETRALKYLVCEIDNKVTRNSIFEFMISNGYCAYRVSYSGLVDIIPYEPSTISSLHGNALFIRTEQ